MRAIDADALKKALRDWIRGYWADDNVGSEFADMIDHAETIEQSPIVHAHWVACEDEYEDEYKCSACGGIQFFAMTPQDEGWEYCPHCGAKMDEEEGK